MPSVLPRPPSSPVNHPVAIPYHAQPHAKLEYLRKLYINRNRVISSSVIEQKDTYARLHVSQKSRLDQSRAESMDAYLHTMQNYGKSSQSSSVFRGYSYAGGAGRGKTLGIQ
jgi:hypothetical protein